MIKSVPQNAVLVELEKLSENEYQFASGLKIYMDTSYAPTQHQRIYGKCVAVPGTLSKDGDMVKFEQDDLRFLDSIVPEVKVGDTVYFNYTSINPANLIEFEGWSYYRISYASIICVVKQGDPAWMDGTILPIGGNILCEEYYGKDAQAVDVDGRKVFGEVSKSSGLITKIVDKPFNKYAVVKIVGTPLREDDVEVSPGDIVMFPNKYGFKNNIEGTDYLCLKYWDIQAIVGNINSESLV
jgi:co-chaperonin GroES (HSP10)